MNPPKRCYGRGIPRSSPEQCFRITTGGVWNAVFVAAAYPEIVSLLVLSDLKLDRDYSFVKRGGDFNVVVVLHSRVPEEAKWIPILEKMFKGP